ncbi:MAG: hypothetical protein HQ582_18575 [Planctomycetes bacterium]|nr:hypothetical protein [Planctomycetota bacterium]
MPITAECGACHKRFKAPDKLAGKRVKCPQCGGVIQVPAPQAPIVEKPAVASRPAEGQVPKSAAAAPVPVPAQAARQCSSCGAALAAKAVLCVSCGLDLRTGQKVEAQPPPIPTAAGPEVTLPKKDEEQQEGKTKKKKKKKRKKRHGELPQGLAFLRGLAVSFGSAMIGSFMWFALAYWLKVEIGIIAWVLGGLAGVGMMIGYGVEDVLAGLGAAAMALLAIFVAKVMIVFAVIGSGDLPEGDYSEDEVFSEIDEGYSEEGMPQGEEMHEREASEEGVPEGGEEAYDDELTADELAAPEEIADEVEVPTAVVVGATIIGSVILGFKLTFWPWLNLLYLSLACATAHQVGSGGGWLGDE